MMKTKMYCTKLMMLLYMMTIATLVACSDDDGNGGGGITFDEIPEVGWTGDLQNGVTTYVPNIYDDEEDMEIQPYFEFNFSGGICQNAEFNVVCENEELARYMESMFQSGKWAEELDEDDDDGDDYYDTHTYKSFRRAQVHMRSIMRSDSNINWADLKLPVVRIGNVLCITIDCLKGKSGNDVKSIILFWIGNGEAPQGFILGTWDDKTCRYTAKNLHGLNITYVIDTAFDEHNLLTKYETSMTFPNKTWAEVLFEMVEEQNQEIGEWLGLYPEATLADKTIKEKAAIFGEISKEQTIDIIATIDNINACPFFIRMMMDF